MQFNNTTTREEYPGIPHVYYYPIRSLEGFISIFGNALLIVSVVKFKNLKTAANMILLSLGVADLATSLTGYLSMAVVILQGNNVEVSYIFVNPLRHLFLNILEMKINKEIHWYIMIVYAPLHQFCNIIIYVS